MRDSVLPLLAVVAVAVFGASTFADNRADVDLWGNVGFVQALPWQPAFHYENAFSFTQPDAAWVNHEWLSQYILHAVHLGFGNAGLLIFKTVLGLLLLALMHAAMRRDGMAGPVRALLTLLVVSTIGYGFSTRPHLFTYLMLALLLTILTRWSDRRAVMWTALPAMGVAWANLHGAFFIGLIALLLFSVAPSCPLCRRGTAGRGEFLTALVGTALFGLGTIVNPYGLRLWSFVGESSAVLRPYLSEWAPFHPARHFADHVDFMALVLLSAGALWAGRRTAGPRRTLLYATALLSAFLLRRNIPLFAIVCVFTVSPAINMLTAPHLRSILDKLRPAVPIGLLLALIVASGARFATRSGRRPLDIEVPADRFPVRIVEWMETNRVRGNLLAFFDWAEMCIWRLPDCPVFIDGRFRSAYDLETIDDFFAFVYGGPAWPKALEDYQTDMVLIHRGNPVYPEMHGRDDWALIVESDLAGLFANRATMRPLVERAARGDLPLPPGRAHTFFP